jgi:hypothetical protein
MKPENYKMSYDKWNDKTGIVAEFRKPGRVDWGRVRALLSLQCGHCVEHKYACGKCSLYKPGVCLYASEHKIAGYHTLSRGYTKRPRNKRIGRRIAERIFKAILKDDPMKEE